jgi:hypothetical protein
MATVQAHQRLAMHASLEIGKYHSVPTTKNINTMLYFNNNNE